MNVKGLELAREEFNQFVGNAVIFMDLEENESWCDAVDIPTYHNEAIVALVGKDGFHSPKETFKLSTLQELAIEKKKMFNQGYERFELEDDYHFAEILFHG